MHGKLRLHSKHQNLDVRSSDGVWQLEIPGIRSPCGFSYKNTCTLVTLPSRSWGRQEVSSELWHSEEWWEQTVALGTQPGRLGSVQDTGLGGKWGERRGNWEFRPKPRQMGQADVMCQDPGRPLHLLSYLAWPEFLIRNLGNALHSMAWIYSLQVVIIHALERDCCKKEETSTNQNPAVSQNAMLNCGQTDYGFRRGRFLALKRTLGLFWCLSSIFFSLSLSYPPAKITGIILLPDSSFGSLVTSLLTLLGRDTHRGSFLLTDISSSPLCCVSFQNYIFLPLEI